jgi:hypothetical protein
MEPRISKADRRQRGAWTQRRDYRDRKGWELATVTSEEGSVPNRAMSAEGRIRALNRRLNMARTPIRVQPTMGELFERYAKDHGDFPWRHKRAKGHPWDLNGHALWSLLSGTAHARMWAVAIATKRKATAPARGSTGSQNVLLTGSDEFMLLFTATAVATSEAALRDLVDYSGHFG